MMLIGKNSVSNMISKLLFVVFGITMLYLLYILFGFAIAFFNLKTGNTILSETFQVKDFGNEFKMINENALGFKFKMPFTESITKGDFTIEAVVSIIFFLGFYGIFLFLLGKIFGELGKEKIFSASVVTSLKNFSILNLIFIPLNFVVLVYLYKSAYHIDFKLLLFHLCIGILVLFLAELFKKGYELQSENDLTI